MKRLLGFWLVLVSLVPLSPFQMVGEACAAEDQTAKAGEEFHTKLFGEPIYVPPRDRRHVTAMSFGVNWIPDGPSFYEILPFGALYTWQNSEDGLRRFRGTFALAFNDLQYNIGSRSGWQAAFTFQNIIIPLGRSEYVEAHRITEVDIEWNQVYGGIGIGYRTGLFPFHQDNNFDVTLTYEPGYLWFKRSPETAANFGVPTDTYEGRLHFKVRADGLARNLMELPHEGLSIGGDFIYGHRSKWQPWGGEGVFDTPNAAKERTFLAGSVYVVGASGVPFVESKRHRLVGEGYAGVGKDLDRFSAFRLPGRPTGYEWEALARPIMPGVAFNELFPRRYGIANLTYRYEALFFLYPYIRVSHGWIETPRFESNRKAKYKMEPIPAISGGLTTGAPWRSQIELNYSYNFGMFRDTGGGRHEQGRHAMFIFWAKELGPNM
jgi:hypothetical protein